MENLIKIISFTYPQEAYLAKGVLESSGISVVIKDELTIQVNNFCSNAIGGVKLFVEQDKADEALLILKNFGYMTEDIPAKDKYTKKETFSCHYTTVCPYCGSTEVLKKRMPGYVFMLSIFLLGFPIPFIKKKYFCFDCNREWNCKKNIDTN